MLLFRHYFLILGFLIYTSSYAVDILPDKVLETNALAHEYFEKAEIYFHVQKFTQAIKWYKQAIKLHKEDGDIVVAQKKSVQSLSQGRKLVQNLIIEDVHEKYIPNQRIQEISARIEKQKLGSNPPKLELRWITLREPSRNDVLDGGETASMVLALRNKGHSSAQDIKIHLKTNNPKGLVFKPILAIDDIAPGDEKNIAISISAKRSITTMIRNFEIRAMEKHGFDSNILDISFQTQKHQPSNIEAKILSISDINHDSKIEPMEAVTLNVEVANTGKGISREISSTVKLGSNLIYLSEHPSDIILGQLAPGQKKNIEFSFLYNHRVVHQQDLDVSIRIYEEDKLLLTLDKLGLKAHVNQDISKVNINPAKSVPRDKNTGDSDIKILKLDRPNKHAVAVIIGNKDYLHTETPAVKYAFNDAKLVKNYLQQTLGYLNSNILYYENATSAVFNTVFGNERNYAGKLYDYVTPNVSDVFIYYSGHGAPDLNNKHAYILPVDYDPSYIEQSSYALNTFFNNINKISAKRLTVVLDTCFSGNSAGGALINNISGTAITLEAETPKNQGTVIYMSAGQNQVSSWYPEKRHGLYTYFFIKGANGAADFNDNGKITTSELGRYTLDTVRVKARQISGLEQTPLFTQRNEFILLDYRGPNTTVSHAN